MSRESDIAIVANAFKVWESTGWPHWPGGMIGYRSLTCSEDGKLTSRKHRCSWCSGASAWIDAAEPLPHSQDCPVLAVERVLHGTDAASSSNTPEEE